MINIFDLVHNLFMTFGLSADIAYALSTVVIISAVIALSVIADFITKKLILIAITRFIKSTKTKLDDIFLKNKVFVKISHLVPAIIIYSLAPIMFPDLESIQTLIQRLCIAYMIFIGALVINALLNSFSDIYGTWKISEEKPITAYIQVFKIFLIVITAILVISSLMNRSPLIFLSGLGAMTAVLMLVFKDTILGFIASIQLSVNDMVRPGDWIEMPKYGADGDIMEVSVNTIKVRNFDKTITTIPTYALISDSFKNWRGMSDAGGRRIKRSINIDMTSVKFCDENMLERFRKIRHIEDYIKAKQIEIDNYNKAQGIDPSLKVNGRRMTNIGTFRAYLKGYLRNHPKIHDKMTLIVRQLPPQADGIPMEIYAFSNDTNWSNYEDLQADIFDHILASLPEFDLRVFQYPSGKDLAGISK